MKSPRIVLGGLAVTAFSIVGGCLAPNKPTTQPGEAPPAPSYSAGDGGGIGAGSAGANPDNASSPAISEPTLDHDQLALMLAQRRSEQFARTAEPLLSARGKSGSADRSVDRYGDRGAEPSAVDWLDPNALSLSPAPSGSSRSARSGAPTTDPAAERAYADAAKLRPTVQLAPPSAGLPISIPGKNSTNPLTKGMMAAVEGPTPNMPLSIGPDAAGGAQPASAQIGASGSTTATLPPLHPGASDLETKFRNRVKEYPRDLAGQLEYQLVLFLENESVPQLGAISGLPQEDRELVASVMDGLSNFRNTVRSDNNMLLSKKIRPLLELADRLRSQADLSIGTLALCTEVRSFGNYEPIDPLRFSAGKDHAVILYTEVQNFASQLTDKQRWETKLTQDVVLYSEAGMQVWSDKTEPFNDLSRVRRQDFFVAKKIKLPANLVIGRYMIKVTVTDQQVNRVAEATLPIVIGAQ